MMFLFSSSLWGKWASGLQGSLEPFRDENVLKLGRDGEDAKYACRNLARTGLKGNRKWRIPHLKEQKNRKPSIPHLKKQKRRRRWLPHLLQQKSTSRAMLPSGRSKS